jgi:hypothetical protein
MTHLEWVRRPPGKRSLKTMRILWEKYAWLEAIVGRHSPLPIPKERQRVYARRFRRRRSSDIPQLPVFRQQLEAICFATVMLGALADDLLRLVEMRTGAIWNWAHRIAADEVTPARARTRGQILDELRLLVADTSLDDASYRSRSAALLVLGAQDPPASRAADVREVLSRNARRIRPALELIVKLNLVWPCIRHQLCRFPILSIDLAEIFECRQEKFCRRCAANKINVIRASKISIRHF